MLIHYNSSVLYHLYAVSVLSYFIRHMVDGNEVCDRTARGVSSPVWRETRPNLPVTLSGRSPSP